MGFDRRQSDAGRTATESASAPRLDPGRRTLTGLIQRKASGAPAPAARPSSHDSATLEAAPPAIAGGLGEAFAAPSEIRARTEAATGADLSGVRMHTGAAAAAEAEGLGARAFTLGQDIHFGPGEYRPGTTDGDHLIAHELTHTIQQAGTGATRQTKLQVGREGDAAEREADAVADAVVAGRPAPEVSATPTRVSLKRKRPAATRPADSKAVDTAVERNGTLSNAYGTYTYTIKKNAGSNGCSFHVVFAAFSPEVDSTKLTFIQTVKGHQAGGAVFYINNDAAYYADFDAAGDGTYADHLKTETDPFYNYEDKTSSDESTGSTGPTQTDMSDGPRIGSIGGERGHDFETAPFALSGKDKGEFFGTLTWGWKIDGTGNFSLNPVAVHDDITTGFGQALRKFVSKMSDMTKTGTTPAPIELEMPIDACRELTDEEKLRLKPIADHLKATANARVWVLARYDLKGFGLNKGNAELNHDMAMDNARTVQQYFKAQGVAIDTVRISALQVDTAKDNKSLVEVSIINS